LEIGTKSCFWKEEEEEEEEEEVILGHFQNRKLDLVEQLYDLCTTSRSMRPPSAARAPSSSPRRRASQRPGVYKKSL
jgi:hypothetical protein